MRIENTPPSKFSEVYIFLRVLGRSRPTYSLRERERGREGGREGEGEREREREGGRERGREGERDRDRDREKSVCVCTCIRRMCTFSATEVFSV